MTKKSQVYDNLSGVKRKEGRKEGEEERRRRRRRRRRR